MDEIPLAGGHVAAGVVRVGDTVRRPVGHWTPAVHALLRHLERVGFAGSSRVLGFDDRGREMLTFVEGVSLDLNASELLDSDEGMARAGALVADLHEALVSFVPPEGVSWWQGAVDPVPSTTVIHGDLGPWNVIVDGDRWSVIDWDAAGPGRLVWERAYALHGFVELWPDRERSDAETVRRIRAFAEGGRLTAIALHEALVLVPERARSIADMLDRLAAEGQPAFVRLQEEGHAISWRDAATHVESRLPHWLAAL